MLKELARLIYNKFVFYTDKHFDCLALLNNSRIKEHLMRRKEGFTLAEILLVITIIGIIFSTICDTIIINLNQHYVAGLKKNISVLNAALEMNVANIGKNASDDLIRGDADLAGWFVYGDTTSTTLKNIIIINKVPIFYMCSAGGMDIGCDTWLPDGSKIIYFFNNPGSAKHGCNEILDPSNFNPREIGNCFVILDVNGDKPPNQYATSSKPSDVWILGISNNKVIPVILSQSTNSINSGRKDYNGNNISPQYSDIPVGNDASYKTIIQ